jgi:hypothetical protein
MPISRGRARQISFLTFFIFSLLLSACGDFGAIIGAGAAAGGAAQTADAATQSALDTEIASSDRPPVLDILDVTLTTYSCTAHDSEMADDYDCSYSVAFTIAYESKDFARAQCFFSNAESEKMNVSPGAGQTTIEVTYEVLVFSPGTTFNGFCQLRDQASDEVIAQDGGPAGGWDISVPAP